MRFVASCAPRALIVAALAGLVPAACAGTTTSTHGTPCLASIPAELPPPLLIYPAPGATAVADATAALVVAGTIPPSAAKPAFYLKRAGETGTTPIGNAIAPPSPLPSPLASYPPSTPLHGVALPALAPTSEYTVLFANKHYTGGCLPVLETTDATLGSFTTK